MEFFHALKPSDNLFIVLECGTLLCGDTLSLRGVEDYLTKSDALGSYLNKLVVGYELNSLLKRKLYGSDKSKLFVST